MFAGRKYSFGDLKHLWRGFAILLHEINDIFHSKLIAFLIVIAQAKAEGKAVADAERGFIYRQLANSDSRWRRKAKEYQGAGIGLFE